MAINIQADKAGNPVTYCVVLPGTYSNPFGAKVR